VSDAATALVVAAAAVVVVMAATWVVSVAVRDASIVDPVWGAGFVVVAWAVRIAVDGDDARQWLLVAMTTVWGLRLAGYLAWRKHGEPEDFRYQDMRAHIGARFWWVSLFTVFLLQGALMWVVSLPVQLGQVPDDPGLGVLAVLGVLLWAVGLGFEVVGDAQLARFKRDPANKGAVMDRGLWRYTRHPNYFGDACVWWGLFLMACHQWPGVFTVVSPIVMTILLTRVSGAALLERDMASRRPGYAEYVARTSGFFPLPPRKGRVA
jgi:steroid 5-alpha reductase family enzyme